MRTAIVLMSLLGLVVGACGGTPLGSSAGAATKSAGATSAGAPTGTAAGEPVLIRTRMVIAAEPGSEPIATGKVLEGSTLGGSPFCPGGTILDSHGSEDLTVEPYGLIDRTITCQDGTVRLGFTPEIVPLDQVQPSSWTIVRGTGAFEGLRGSGEMETAPDPDDVSLGFDTLTGTATR